MTFGELFAGIGGFSLGLERAGMTCKWQVEIEPYARAVLNKHWPDVPKHDDVRTFPPQGDYGVDLICGGFPCQDISVAGKGAGLAGSRSGLWYEYARIIGELRPRYVVVENVAALLTRGMGTVLGDLSSLGYDAEWHVIPASAVGAPHRRDRVWIVAHAANDGCAGRAGLRADRKRTLSAEQGAGGGQACRRRQPRGCREDVANAERERLRVCGRSCTACEARAVQGKEQERQRLCVDAQSSRQGGNVSHACRNGWQGCWQDGHVARSSGLRSGAWSDEEQDIPAAAAGWWESEPDVGRVAHGIPSRVDRLRCLGNAVVPQVVEVIGRAILEAEARMTA